MTRNKIPKVRLKNHIVIQTEEEVIEGERVVDEIIFLEEEEEAEEEK
jgi:hypothetical protein